MERKIDFDPQNAAKKLLREGRSGALAVMTRYGNVPGISALVGGDQLPP